MGIFLSLSGIALREVVSGVLGKIGLDKGADAVMGFLAERITDHSQRLTKALQNANERAWKAFEVALGGESLWDRCTKALASAEDKAFREQVRAFLDCSPLTKLSAEHAQIFKLALKELRAIRSDGVFKAGSLGPSELVREAGVLARFNDPQALLDAEWLLVDQAASELREHSPNLWKLLVDRPKAANKPSLLVVAVRYYFRREVESDQALFQGLAFVKWEAMQVAQEKGFAALTDAISRQGKVLEGMLSDIAGTIIIIDSTTKETLARVRHLEEQIQKLLTMLQLQGRELRPGDSMSVRGGADQQKVQDVVAEYHALPEAARQQRPGLLNTVGVLEAAAGELEDAQKHFQEAAVRLSDPKDRATALHNAYRAALERHQWDAALKAMQQAVALEPERFAPFPFDNYQPQRILGAGGFGTVYLCRHAFFLNKELVVKALHCDDLERPVADVFAEAHALSELNHPAIIGVQNCSYADPGHTRPYIVMPYFKGTSLEQFVQERGTLSWQQLVAVARQIAEGMKAVHARGILHRDLKPDNILVRKEGDTWHVKIIDFGLAVKAAGQADGGSSSAKSIFGKSVAGTLKYAPPEQLGEMPGIKPGPYSDVYAFGKLCCYALFHTTAPLMSHWKSLPPDLADMLNGCLQENLESRHRNFEPVLQALDTIDGNEGGPDKSPFEQDMKDALEEMRTKGITRAYFERQGPTHIGGWQVAAQQGDAVAQWLLGCCLYEGTGAHQDTQAALALLRQAAKSGLAVAQTDLGDCYYLGEGVEADPSEAFRLYTAAAAQGFPEAHVDLGDCFWEGKGVVEDLTEAARHYRMGAEADWARGQDSLGDCYFDGSGVEQDYPKAIGWYRKAAEQGLATAQGNLGWCYEYGKGVKKSWGEAANWYRKAAEQGSDVCQCALGYCYENGYGVEVDLAQAEQWYRKAAEQGFKKAKNALKRIGIIGVAPEIKSPQDADTKGYWVIAPYSADSPDEWQRVWEFDLANNMISIGWEELGDISSLDEQGLRAAIDRTYAETSNQGKGMYFGMLWHFYHSIKLGDVILARQGTKKLAAVGTVIRTAYHEPNKNHSAVGDASTFANHLDVRWADSPRDKQFPDIVFGMQTVYKMPEEKFRLLVGKMAPEI